MRRRALLAAPLLLIPGVAMADDRRSLHDYTPERYEPLIRRAMRAWDVPWRYVMHGYDPEPDEHEGDITASIKPGQVAGYNMTTLLRHRTVHIRWLDRPADDVMYALVVHELGHAIGLGDNDEPDSVMNDDPFTHNAEPTKADLQRARKKLR